MVSRIAGRHGAQVGGFTLARAAQRVVVVAGPWTTCSRARGPQAMQNLNLALGIDELTSIPH